MAPIEILVRRLHPERDADLPLPERGSAEAAGFDLRAAYPPGETAVIDPGQWLRVPTGLAIALPPGYELQIRPRSGLAARHAVTVLNAPGTIDSDYRGEVQVLLINHGREPFEIKRGDRVAQAVVAPVQAATWTEARELPDSRRGAGGFGSTGQD